MKKYLNKIHYYKNLNAVDQCFKGFLAVLSAEYYIGITIRNFLYSKNIIKRTKLPAYVISVGNLTTGGTGKTPVTIKIAEYIKEKLHKKTAILSRGYGGKLPGDKINVISDGNNILQPAELAGDEPYLMATKLKDIPVLTGKSRINSGKYAVNNFGSEVLILDDGFQHIKLKRDLNILIIDCNKIFGNKLLLPAGPLREPLTEIRRADRIIVVNKKPDNKESQDSCTKLMNCLEQKFNKPVFPCNIKNGKIYNIKTRESLNSVEKVMAFTAIAQPEFFFNYLKTQNINLVATEEFADHHLYTENDLKDIIKKAQEQNAEAIITTEKDAVKLLPLLDKVTQVPIFALELELELDLGKIMPELGSKNKT